MGTPVWSHEGIVCTGESYKLVVKLTFARGASLGDPSEGRASPVAQRFDLLGDVRGCRLAIGNECWPHVSSDPAWSRPMSAR